MTRSRIRQAERAVAHLEPSDELELEAQNRTIVVQPVASKPSLQQLLNAITPQNCHPPTDWGRPVGNEAW
jgi:antitoxin component of MazEF toxin-antitoxin module